MSTKGKGWSTRETRQALARVKRIKRELADWPMTEARQREKLREIDALRVTFNL